MGKRTAHCRAINPDWESKIWPLPAFQGEVEPLEPEVLALPHPAFCQASHVPGTVWALEDLGKIVHGCFVSDLLR